MLVILAPQALTEPTGGALALAEAMKERRYPVFTCWMGGKSIAKALQVLNDAGIPTYETPERAVRAFLYMVEYARNMEMLLEIPPKLTKEMSFDTGKAKAILRHAPQGEFMAESDSKDILAAYGSL